MLLLNRYSYNPQTDFIADGGHSKVYKALDTQQGNLPLVIKFYYRITTDSFKDNMERVKGLSHPHLVKLHDYIELESVNAWGQTDILRVGVWEYVPDAHSDISTENAKNTEQNIRDLISALQYLHQNNCAHLALQRDNVLISGNGALKLNNYEINRSEDYQASDQQKDLQDLGQTLYELLGGTSAPHLSANMEDEINRNLPSNLHEVYGVIIKKYSPNGAKSNSLSIDNLNDLLNNYDRNKRFDAVVALNEYQFLSRYAFDPDTDKVAQNNVALTYKAYDNLLNKEVKLEIFMLDEQLHGASLLANLPQKNYAHLFKVNLSNDDYGGSQIALVGIQQSAQQTTTTNEHAEIAALIALDNSDDDHVSLGDSTAYEEMNKEQASEVAPIRDSTGLTLDTIDDNLARELAALDEQVSQTIVDKENNDEEIAITSDPFRDKTDDNETSDNEAEETSHSEAMETSMETSTDVLDITTDDLSATAADDGDILQLQTPDTTQEDLLTSTEMIEHEAIEQVLRDFQLQQQSQTTPQVTASLDEVADDILPNSDDLLKSDTPEMAADEALKGTQMIEHEAIEQVLRDFQLQQQGNENPPANKQTIDLDDDDIVNINTPDLPEYEAIKGTEIIEHEAIEQVLRDMERLLKNNK
jgi:serine/threonine protein kinase